MNGRNSSPWLKPTGFPSSKNMKTNKLNNIIKECISDVISEINHLSTDDGSFPIAVGAPGSLSQVKATYPNAIKVIAEIFKKVKSRMEQDNIIVSAREMANGTANVNENFDVAHRMEIVIKPEVYGISVIPYNPVGDVAGGGLLRFSYQDDQYNDALKIANYLKSKYPKYKIVDLVKSKTSVGDINEEFSSTAPRTANIELIKKALQRVQFDKPMAVNFLRQKEPDNREFQHAADYLDKMSILDVRSLFSSIREDGQVEPYDAETDISQPSPRNRTNSSKSSIKLTPTGQADDWSRPIYKDQSGKIYLDINCGNGSPSIHSTSNQGEPEFPIKNYTIKSKSNGDKFKNALCPRCKNSKPELMKKSLDGKMSCTSCNWEDNSGEPNPQINEAGVIKPTKLSNSERNKIGLAFKKLGLDGNGRFESPGQGLTAISNALSTIGFALNMVVGGFFSDAGQKLLPFRRANDQGQDVFTDKPDIENSRIAFSWQNLSGEGQPKKYEVLVYAS